MNQEQDEKPKSEKRLPRWSTTTALIPIHERLFPNWHGGDSPDAETSASHRHSQQGISTMRCCLITIIIGAIAVGLWISFILLMAKIYPGDPIYPVDMTAEAIREHNQGTELPYYWVTETVTP